MKVLKIFLIVFFLTGCTKIPTPQEQYENLFAATGLKRLDMPNAEGMFLGKNHRGYEVLGRIEMGDVWGRYAARVAMSEAGRELGGVWGFLTGSYEHVSAVVGSPLDRVLSEVIGQPLSMFFVLKHDKQSDARVDIYNMFSTIKPYDPQPEIKYIGLNTGTLYASDRSLADKILSDASLIQNLGYFRSMYIRVDSLAVTFAFAGSENDYSYMIREAGSYENLLRAILDSLAQLADKL